MFTIFKNVLINLGNNLEFSIEIKNIVVQVLVRTFYRKTMVLAPYGAAM